MQLNYIMDLHRIPQVVLLLLHEFFHLHFALCSSKILELGAHLGALKIKVLRRCALNN